MKDFCIPKNLIAKISRQIDDTSIEKLFDMPTEERIKFFSTHADNALAVKISGSFDDILAEAKRDSLIKAFKLLGAKDKAPDIFKGLKKLTNNELLDPKKTDGIINEITGIASGGNITEAETKVIVDLGSKIEKYKTISDSTPMVKNGLWNPKWGEAFLGFAKHQSEMDKFIISKTPVSKSETFWSHTKASMLLNPPSWAVNIISNVQNAGLEAISRRAGTMKLGGYNSEIASSWKTVMSKVYKETGNDYSRALSLDDMVTGKGKLLGEIGGTGKDTWLTKLVFEKALGSPDAWSARMTFADSANLYSSKIADGLGLKGAEAKRKAGEILADAFNVIPRTEDGKIIREMSVADALRATYTNDSWASDLSLGMKKLINSIPVIGKSRPGDLIEPFVKTPANVIEQGLDLSGVGFLKATVKTVKYFKTRNLDEKIAQQHLLGALKDGSKAGVGMTVAGILALSIGNDNFVGAYDPGRHKIELLKNTNYNAVKIGDKWVSLDYLGPVGTPLVAMLTARKYGNGNAVDTLGAYMKGMFTQSLTIPFVGSLAEMVDSYKEATSVRKEKFLPTMSKVFIEQIASRIPGVSTSIAKMTDTQVRDVYSGKFGIYGMNADPIIAKIPWASRHLPGKTNILGEPIKTEQYSKVDNVMIGIFTTMLSGARIKTEQSSPEGREIYRLNGTGNMPAITNWKYSLPRKLQALKDKVGEDKYNSLFTDEFGPRYKQKISALLNSQKYKDSNDEEKKKLIDAQEDIVINSIYSKNSIK